MVLLSKGRELRAPAKHGPGGYIIGEFPHGPHPTEWPNLLLEVKRGKVDSKPTKKKSPESDDDDDDDSSAEADPKAKAMKKVMKKPAGKGAVLKKPAGKSKQASLQDIMPYRFWWISL